MRARIRNQEIHSVLIRIPIKGLKPGDRIRRDVNILGIRKDEFAKRISSKVECRYSFRDFRAFRIITKHISRGGEAYYLTGIRIYRIFGSQVLGEYIILNGQHRI